jgi:hypothetical protein
MYVAIDGELYKHRPSAVGIMMKCIPTHQGKELLLEIHAGICGHHAALWSLVGKALFANLFCPSERAIRSPSAT